MSAESAPLSFEFDPKTYLTLGITVGVTVARLSLEGLSLYAYPISGLDPTAAQTYDFVLQSHLTALYGLTLVAFLVTALYTARIHSVPLVDYLRPGGDA